MRENELVYLPLGAVHRLENPGQASAQPDRGAVGSLLWPRTISYVSTTSTSAFDAPCRPAGVVPSGGSREEDETLSEW